MPSERFERDLIVTGSTADVWRTLTDVPTLVGWISIVHDASEIEPLSKYTAVLQDSIGPFKLKADLKITLSEVETERRLRIQADGEDRQVSSRITIDAVLEIQPDEADRTQVHVAGEYAVNGKVATMGSGMIKKKAQKILDEFFAAAGSYSYRS